MTYEIKPFSNLQGADLLGANLQGANLQGANLGNQWIIQGPMRSDGYYFFLQQLTEEKEPMIKAGCRYFTIEEAKVHWSDQINKFGHEALIIVDGMVALAKAQGKIKHDQT